MRVSDIPPANHVGDAVAGGAAVAAIMGWLPPIAAVLSIFWFAYQIYDMWDRRRRRRQTTHGMKRRATDVPA